MNKPLILSPAGSYNALIGALNAGADEVYFGALSFNARQNADNFTKEQLSDAIKLCRLLGVKTNITVNTLISDRELNDVLHLVYDLSCLGADAFIVQDLGLAKVIKECMQGVTLHASTQCACHNLEGSKKLQELGFSRIVLARELSLNDIKQITSAGIETEIFVHGALCVCHSGMCLMSSVIGKRSGNRGLCAQPCRLPYSLETNNSSYPLSLKDLSLSNHIQEILSSGVTSLKIEGRMKSPDYVYGVTKLWREMIDSEKCASKDQNAFLEDLFSRGGFTDKYFDESYLKNNKSMYGTRTSLDKQKTHVLQAQITSEHKLTRKKDIRIECILKENHPAKLTLHCDNISTCYESQFLCEKAKSNPICHDDLKKSLSKLGNTAFECSEDLIKTEIYGNVFLTKSNLNELRRNAIQKLESIILSPKNIAFDETLYTKPSHNNSLTDKKAVLHISLKSFCDIPKQYNQKDIHYISVPLQEFLIGDEKVAEKYISQWKENGIKIGVRLPRVYFNGEYEYIKKTLKKAKSQGIDFAVISNIGHIQVAKECGLFLFGDVGLNVYNSQTLSTLQMQGFDIITLSPELNTAQMRDIDKSNVKTAIIAKGRLELMVLESCIVRSNGKCNQKDGICSLLTDRKGYKFPVGSQRRFTNETYPCRNIIYNSVETDLLSKPEDIKKTNADILTILL